MDYATKEDLIERLFDKIKSFIIPEEGNNFRSRFLQSNTLLYFVVLFSALKILASLSAINFPQNIFFADITKSVLETSVNQTRKSAGLSPLVESVKLDQAAQMKADNMVQDNYFDHTSPSGVTPWYWFLKAGYEYKYAGENLAIGFYDSKEVFNAWLNSPSHKANILNPNYKEVGTAVVGGAGKNGAIIVVQEFGALLPAEQIVVNKEVASPENYSPVQTATQQPQPSGVPEKVLSQSVESPSIVAPTKGMTANNAYSETVNFVLYNYESLLQYVLYGISLIVIGIILAMIFFNIEIKLKKQLIFRAVLILAILSLATFVNREVIVSFIPHQIMI